MSDKMIRTSFFVPESMMKKVRQISEKKHESMANTIRYILEKGLEKDTLETRIKKNHEQMTASDDQTNQKLKYLMFKSVIRLDSIAENLMGENGQKITLSDYKLSVEKKEKEFRKKFNITV